MRTTHRIFSLPPFFNLVLKLAAFYLLFFFCCRLLFCYFDVPATNHEPPGEYGRAFFMGLRFDLIITSYLLMLPALLLFFHQAFLKHSQWLIRGIKFYFWIVTALTFFIACADIPYFSQFGSHISKSVFAWRLTLGYTMALIFSDFFYWGFSLVFLLFFIVFIFFLNQSFKSYYKKLAVAEPQNLSRALISVIVLAALLFVFARGRLSAKSPMHEGMAIVGQNAFVNQVPLNANFTLIKSLSRKKETRLNLEAIGQDQEICSRFFKHNFFPQNGILSSPIQALTPPDSIKKLNVVVVLMESMSIAKMGYYGNKNLSPYLTQLAGESVFFDRFFSSGIHTFNGLFSSATGFPTIYTEQGLRQYTRQPFITLANLLKPYSYRSFFCATHDPVFDNMEGFFTLNGFDRVISSNDFKSSESMGVTGIPDHRLYAKLIEEINAGEKEKPFVAYVMTGTDHGPWTIPSGIDFKPTGADEKERASQYADWAVKQFMDEAKRQSWYKNTVFVFTGDHGQIVNDPYDMPITYHHVPLIIHCPQQLPPAVNHHLGYQPDLVKTLASLLNVRYQNFSFGVNIMEEQRPLVFFSADDKIGYVTEDDLFFYHLLGSDQKKLVKYTGRDERDYYSLHKQRADSLYGITRSLYNAAQYYIHNNYFSF
jgi:phosphoglycerol transferase MdoB-like AlkP superfamily enzyme